MFIFIYEMIIGECMAKKIKKWKRNCPECGEIVKHTNKNNRNKAVKEGWLCRSCSQKGRIFTPEHKKKISQSLIGKKQPIEVVKKRTEKIMGDLNPAKRPEVRKKISLSKMGDKNPAKRFEVRQKISESLKKYERPKEKRILWIKRLSKANKNKVFTEETRKKISNSLMGHEVKESSKRKRIETIMGISYEEYINSLSYLEKYRRDVKKYTKKSLKNNYLLNYDKRGRIENGGWHLDHIVSIIYGFRNKILPKKIGSIENLRMISAQDNLLKWERIDHKGQSILKMWKNKGE